MYESNTQVSTKIKPKDYEIMVTSLMANPEEVEAPEGASKKEQLNNILKTIAQVELQKVQQKKIWSLVTYGTRMVIIILSLVNFYHKFLHRHKWSEKYDVTNFLLTEHCG